MLSSPEAGRRFGTYCYATRLRCRAVASASRVATPQPFGSLQVECAHTTPVGDGRDLETRGADAAFRAGRRLKLRSSTHCPSCSEASERCPRWVADPAVSRSLYLRVRIFQISMEAIARHPPYPSRPVGEARRALSDLSNLTRASTSAPVVIVLSSSVRVLVAPCENAV